MFRFPNTTFFFRGPALAAGAARARRDGTGAHRDFVGSRKRRLAD
jgi:hypothetical protein